MGVVQGDSRAVKTLAKDTGQILGSVALARFTRARRSLSQPGRESFDRVLQPGTEGARRSRGPGLVLSVRINGEKPCLRGGGKGSCGERNHSCRSGEGHQRCDRKDREWELLPCARILQKPGRRSCRTGKPGQEISELGRPRKARRVPFDRGSAGRLRSSVTSLAGHFPQFRRSRLIIDSHRIQNPKNVSGTEKRLSCINVPGMGSWHLIRPAPYPPAVAQTLVCLTAAPIRAGRKILPA